MVEAEDHERHGELNQYCVDNAWYKVNFGGCKYGIFSAACPIEPLHAIENGIIPDCIKILYHEYIKSSKDLAKLDDLVQQLTELPRQCLATAGSNPAMPIIRNIGDLVRQLSDQHNRIGQKDGRI